MKKKLISISILLFAGFILILSGCRKEKSLIDQVDKMNFTSDMYEINGPIDEWLYQNFTLPYNIRIEYKWDRSEADLSKQLTPIDEKNVIPVAQNILDFFIQPYLDEAGEFFVKRYPPKQYLFIGSPQYNSNGTVRTGAADAGRKIILYRLNQMDQNDETAVKRMLKTVHHEFAHILDHNKAVTVDFGLMAKGDYVDDDWNSYTDQQGWDLGFISNYARSQESDDFAETVAILLVYGQENFEKILAAAAPEGRAILQKKEQLVIDYFDLSWGIDFSSLQQRIQDSYPDFKIIKPAFPENVGEGQLYSGFELNSDNSDRGEFEDYFNDLTEEALANGGRYLNYIRVFFNPDDKQIYVDISRYSSGTSGSSSHGRVFFDYEANDDGIMTFTIAAGGRAIGESGSPEKTTSTSTGAAVQSLIDWLSNGKFIYRWVDEGKGLGGLFEVDNNGVETDNYFYGYMDGDETKVVPSLLPPFPDYFGDGLQYNGFEMNEDNLVGPVLDFYNGMNDYMFEHQNRYNESIRILHNQNDKQIIIKIYRYAAGAGKSGSASYFRIYYDYEIDQDGIMTFTEAAGGIDISSGDAKTTSSSKKDVPALTDFITSNKFIMDWKGKTQFQGGLYAVDDQGKKTGEYLYGDLGTY